MTLTVTDTAPILDGVLNDQCWSKAAGLTGFQGLGNLNAKADAATATRVMITRDNVCLYMAFVCSNAMMKHVTQQVFDHDGPVNMDEDVEMYFVLHPINQAIT